MHMYKSSCSFSYHSKLFLTRKKLFIRKSAYLHSAKRIKFSSSVLSLFFIFVLFICRCLSCVTSKTFVPFQLQTIILSFFLHLVIYRTRLQRRLCSRNVVLTKRYARKMYRTIARNLAHVRKLSIQD